MQCVMSARSQGRGPDQSFKRARFVCIATGFFAWGRAKGKAASLQVGDCRREQSSASWAKAEEGR